MGMSPFLVKRVGRSSLVGGALAQLLFRHVGTAGGPPHASFSLRQRISCGF